MDDLPGSLDGIQGVRQSILRLHSLEGHPDSLGGPLTAEEDQGRSSWSVTLAQRLVAILLIATIGSDRPLSIGCGQNLPPSRQLRRWVRPLRPIPTIFQRPTHGASGKQR